MQDMVASFRLTARVLFFGIATACTAAGCNEMKSPTKEPAPAGPAMTSKETPKAETPAPKVAADESKAAADDSKTEADEIKATRAKLSPEDRKLVEAQEWCAVNTDDRLGGSMGSPIKLMIKGEPVFICCKGCKKEAEANPDKTLAKVKELKEKKKAELSKK
jgi:hypothetical protein